MSDLTIKGDGDLIVVASKGWTHYLDDSDVDRIVAIRDARRAKEREARHAEYLKLKAEFEP